MLWACSLKAKVKKRREVVCGRGIFVYTVKLYLMASFGGKKVYFCTDADAANERSLD